MTGILVAGTASDVGKSVVTTGLCRALIRRGYTVAPFKAQNMSNNSMVCPGPDGDGVEIGRAQWVQALAARVAPETAMNPVLIKPGSDRLSHVVLMGKPWGEVASSDWLDGRRALARAAYAAFDDLTARFDIVVAEGAGSPAEINLRAGDYVNLGLARRAGLPTVVVGDIDRGGVFAALLGTVALLSPTDQSLIAGFIVNKFRGDPALLQPGLRDLERLTGRRIYGTLPWHPDVWLDSEDTLELAGRCAPGIGRHRVAVVRLPRMSNFTDVDALGLEPDVEVVFVSDPRDVGDADLVVLPGTRATIADLAWLRSRGLDDALTAHVRAGKPLIGVCGGFQMLGRVIRDPQGVEGPITHADGLGLLDVETTFSPSKVLRLSEGFALGEVAAGYEIHHGRINRGDGGQEFLGGARTGQVFGTMWHGCLESDGLRAAFLRETLGIQRSGVSFAAVRERRFEVLGDLVDECLDVEALVELIGNGPRGDLPFLAPGAP